MSELRVVDALVAKEYGINEAFVIRNLQFWIYINKKNNIEKRGNSTWMYRSLKNLSEDLGLLSRDQLNRVSRKLVKIGVIKKAYFNKEKNGDNITFYAFVDEKKWITPEVISEFESMSGTKNVDITTSANSPLVYGQIAIHKDNKNNTINRKSKDRQQSCQSVTALKSKKQKPVNEEDQNPDEYENSSIKKTRKTKISTSDLKSVANIENKTIEEAVQFAKDQNGSAVEAKRERSREQMKKGEIKFSSLESSWLSGIREKYGDSHVLVGWGKKEFGQVGHLIKKIGIDPDQLMNFFYFCSNKWPEIITTQYEWAKSELRNEPNIGFLLKYVSGFVLAWNDKGTMTGDDGLSLMEGIDRQAVRRGAGGADTKTTDKPKRAEFNGSAIAEFFQS